MVNQFPAAGSNIKLNFAFPHPDHSRAKEKRLKKDAGRTRWSQYFRSMKGGSSPSKLLDKDDMKVDLDSFSHHGECRPGNVRKIISKAPFRADLSNDSYSTVNMGLDDGASPHSGRGSYIHSSASPPYLSSHSPNPVGQGHYSYADNIVYTPLGEFAPRIHQLDDLLTRHPFVDNPVSSMLHLQGSTVSDLSNDSSPAHGYPDFPPSPDSWLGNENNSAATSTPNNNSTNNQSSSHY